MLPSSSHFVKVLLFLIVALEWDIRHTEIDNMLMNTHAHRRARARAHAAEQRNSTPRRLAQAQINSIRY
jgi:hypothetical protein